MESEELTDDLGIEDANLTGTDTAVIESDADIISRLEAENKSIKDGNSNLGREFKSYREESDDKYDALLDKISEMNNTTTTPVEEDVYASYEDEEDKRLAAIADKRIEASVKKNEQVRARYIEDYTKAAQALGKNEDAGVYEAILNNMEGMSSFSTNGSEDALRHYQKAEGEYYKDQYRQVSNRSGNTAFRGQSPAGGVGGTGTVETRDTTDSVVANAEADPAIQSYMKWRNHRKGNDPEFLKKALTAEKSLSGNR